MLQQTQVKNVLPFYKRFIGKFPALNFLAEAKESEVLKYWTGLGYYSRARNMLKTAKLVRKNYEGRFPDQMDSLLQLPGVGPYTAGAILSIAYHLPYPILDGNVRRVLSRLLLIHSQRELWKLSEEMVKEASGDRIDPSEYNQSLMELGALICLPANPLCGQCPVSNICKAKKRNLQHEYPASRKKQKIVQECYALLALQKEPKHDTPADREFLIRRRSSGRKLLKGAWEFPAVSLGEKVRESSSPKLLGELERKFSREIGYRVKIEKKIGEFRHSITHHRLRFFLFKGNVKNVSYIRFPSDYRWIKKSDAVNFFSSSILTKSILLLGQGTTLRVRHFPVV